MSDFIPSDSETDALLSRVLLIEDQPLAERAAAFAAVHDQLQSVLERGDAQQRSQQ
ncbi:hypothetical protein [Glaciihabitans arcticus]|uniref:hypothetical protein n=1 Tax=Glaciihabitans arcticus TaxID=2668039 RepID=UPI001873BD0E|nr:hypothetical protein [Glaciihabitans arcticus]